MLLTLANLANLQCNLISESLVVFVCATSGEGDPPDNMKVQQAVKTLTYLYANQTDALFY